MQSISLMEHSRGCMPGPETSRGHVLCACRSQLPLPDGRVLVYGGLYREDWGPSPVVDIVTYNASAGTATVTGITDTWLEPTIGW
jgi:hypothetical protein